MAVDVELIAALREQNATYHEIGDVTGLSPAAISAVCLLHAIEKPRRDGRSKCWKGVRGPVVTANGTRRFLPPEDRRMLKLEREGLNPGEIARKLGRKRQVIVQRQATLARRQERKASQL